LLYCKKLYGFSNLSFDTQLNNIKHLNSESNEESPLAYKLSNKVYMKEKEKGGK
jgi:hypothetical protein